MTMKCAPSMRFLSVLRTHHHMLTIAVISAIHLHGRCQGITQDNIHLNHGMIYTLSFPVFPLPPPTVSFHLPQCCCSSFLSVPFFFFFFFSLDFHHFPSACHPDLFSLQKKNPHTGKMYLWFPLFSVSEAFHDNHATPVSPRHRLLISISFRTCHLVRLHFLVLTSLSIRALRVLCTSSPSLSISAFKRSFCSVSSCTFLSFSCSLSLRLFLVEE